MVVHKIAKLVGKRAPEVYTGVISSMPQVREVAIARYTLPPPIQERARLSQEERRLVELAAEARATTRLSYLEILLEMSAKAEHSVDGILDAVSYHRRHSVNRTWLSREDVLKGRLISVCATATPGAPLAVLSRVKIGSSCFRHIPLLDFHVEKSRRSLGIVLSIAHRLLDGPYAVLETPRSYHLVGMQLLTQSQANRFLSKAILFSPITDHAYIAHQLLEGESALRITSRAEPEDVPRLVRVASHGRQVRGSCGLSDS